VSSRGSREPGHHSNSEVGSSLPTQEHRAFSDQLPAMTRVRRGVQTAAPPAPLFCGCTNGESCVCAREGACTVTVLRACVCVSVCGEGGLHAVFMTLLNSENKTEPERANDGRRAAAQNQKSSRVDARATTDLAPGTSLLGVGRREGDCGRATRTRPANGRATRDRTADPRRGRRDTRDDLRRRPAPTPTQTQAERSVPRP
jgi:hypothetical protein